MEKFQKTSTKLFTLLNNSINGLSVLIMEINFLTYSANPNKTI